MSMINKNKMSILIVSGSCCMPNMALVDDQVRQAVEKIVAEEHIDADIQVMTMTRAFYGGIPRSIVAPVLDKFNKTGKMIDLPAILVNGTLTTTGIPDPGHLRAALRKAAGMGEAV